MHRVWSRVVPGVAIALLPVLLTAAPGQYALHVTIGAAARTLLVSATGAITSSGT